MDLLSYFRILKRHWVMLLVFVVAGAAIGAASTALSSGSSSASGPKSVYYKATNTLLFKPDSGSTNYPSSFNNLDQIALLATTGPVPDAVAKKLGGSATGQSVSERLTTLTNTSAGTVAITAIGRAPEEAASLADDTANALVADLSATDLQTYNDGKTNAQQQLATLQGQIDGVKAQLGTVPPPANANELNQQLTAYQQQYTQAFVDAQQYLSKGPPVSPLRTLQKADALQIDASEYDARLNQGRLGQNNLQAGGGTPIATVSTSSGTAIEGPIPRGIFGALIGLLLGIGVVMLSEHLDRRIRSHDAAEQAFRWPVIGDVPHLGTRQQAVAIAAQTMPLSPVADAYRAVRSAIFFQLSLSDADAPSSIVIMVTSALPGDGKTTSAANLAVVCAQAGARVLVVNCDFRRPTIHRAFGIDNLARRVQPTSEPGVSVITNVVREDSPNPAQVVGIQRQVIGAARQRFDVIILDTAPILSTNDAIDLVADVDAVLLVAKNDATTVPAAERAAESLRRIDAPVVGVALLGSLEVGNAYNGYYQPDPTPAPVDDDTVTESRRDRRTRARSRT